MANEIIDKLPSVEELERALAECRQDALVLRSLLSAMRRRRRLRDVSTELRRQVAVTHESGVQHDA